MAQQNGRHSTDALWSSYARSPRQQVRERLIEEYRPLALSVLRHLGYGGDEDLQQVALLGLVKSVDRYDPTSGYRFSTFAVPTIMGEIKRYLRDHQRLVRPPRWLFELHTAVVTKQNELATKHGHAPTLAEVAEALGVELDRVVEAMAMDESCQPQSLDGLLQSLENDRLLTLAECLGGEDPELERIESRLAWDRVLDGLGPLLRKVIELRYYQNMTQKEVAQRLGVSQMQISRLERRALQRLRGCACDIGAIEELSLAE